MILARVLEPEANDSLTEALAYDAIDHSAVNLQFVGDLLDQLPGGGPVLDLGTGTARIPIELHHEQPDVRVVGIDLSAGMLTVAQSNVATAGAGDRIDLRRVDAKRLPFGDESFPVVMSNSFLHHAPEPDVVLCEAWRVLAVGGLMFMRDLVRPRDETALEHLIEAYGAEATECQLRMFADSLRAAITVDEMRDLVGRIGCPVDTVRATSDRHWTWSCRKGLADDGPLPAE